MSFITRNRTGLVTAKFNKKYLSIEEIDIVRFGIASYSFLLPFGTTKMSEFADLMVSYSDNEKTKMISDTINKSDICIYGCLITHVEQGNVTKHKCTVRASSFEEAKRHLALIYKDVTNITHTYLGNIFVAGTMTTYCTTR